MFGEFDWAFPSHEKDDPFRDETYIVSSIDDIEFPIGGTCSVVLYERTRSRNGLVVTEQMRGEFERPGAAEPVSVTTRRRVNAGDWVTMQRTDYTYDENRRVVRSITYFDSRFVSPGDPEGCFQDN